MTTTELDTGVFIDSLTVDEIFVDHTYQRGLDITRIRKIAHTWDRRLVGILEVSDRGPDATPRYAVVDGMHRWAAARSLQTPPNLVANVHSGLTVADEAALFDNLNRQRRQTNTWDHWKARSAAGDPAVTAIEAVTSKHGLRIEPGPRDGLISCTAALEKVAKLGGTNLIDECLSVIVAAWQTRREGLDAPIIHGLALVLHHLRDELDLDRLTAALIDVMPRQIKTQAVAMREISPGTLPTVTAIVIMNLYNKRAGRRIDVTHKTFGGTGIRNNTPKAHDAPSSPRAQRRTASQSNMQSPSLEQVGDPTRQPPRKPPNGLPPTHRETDQHADAVAAMEGQSVPAIAQALGIPERTVRRIHADLGIDVAS